MVAGACGFMVGILEHRAVLYSTEGGTQKVMRATEAMLLDPGPIRSSHAMIFLFGQVETEDSQTGVSSALKDRGTGLALSSEPPWGAHPLSSRDQHYTEIQQKWKP